MSDYPKLYCVQCDYTVGFAFRGSSRWPQHCGQLMVRAEDRPTGGLHCGESNPDYVTVLPALGGKWVACHMRFNAPLDQYEIRQSWGPLNRVQAGVKAMQWAKESGLEYRP